MIIERAQKQWVEKFKGDFLNITENQSECALYYNAPSFQSHHYNFLKNLRNISKDYPVEIFKETSEGLSRRISERTLGEISWEVHGEISKQSVQDLLKKNS